jgi:hypothetical protein
MQILLKHFITTGNLGGKMHRIILISFVCCCFSLTGFAQEHAEESSEHSKPGHPFLHHRLSAGFGYTFVPKGVDESSEEEGILAPTISVEYFYKFSHRWAAGLMVDMEMSQYLIPFLDDFLTRDKALIIGAVGLYEPIEYWGIFAGAGMEIESHHNFAVIRVGTDYEFLIGNNWDISPSLSFDFKEEYSSWALMVGFGKHF